MIERLRIWLLKKLAGKRTVMMNVGFHNGTIQTTEHALFIGCRFEGNKTVPLDFLKPADEED